MGRIHRELVSIVLVFVLFVTLSYQYWRTAGRSRTLHTTSERKSNSVGVTETGTTTPCIKLGDLPGYSGWARPSSSLVSSFYIVDESAFGSGRIVAYQNFTFHVATDHFAGQRGGALFFVRAYGSSVLTGTVEDLRNGTYSITLFPMDDGPYTVEVVLTFSQHPEWEAFPVQNQSGYEGFLLQSFPRAIFVSRPKTMTTRDKAYRICRPSDLFERDFFSALRWGRWKVVNQTRNQPYSLGSQYEPLDQQLYASGERSLGIQMDYQPSNCSLLPIDLLSDLSFQRRLTRFVSVSAKPLHIVFVGDSNMIRLHQLFQKQFGKSPWLFATMVGIRRGILPRLQDTKERLADLSSLDHHFFVVFNSGLHDIHGK